MTMARFHPPPSKQDRQTGFTLIEVLVAVTLMAVVSVISWRGLDSIAALRERLAEDAAQTDRLLSMLGQLERDLAMRAPDVALRAAMVAPLPDGKMAVPARSLPLSVAVTRTTGTSPTLRLEIIRTDPAGVGALQQVVWWLQDGSLRRAGGAPTAEYPLAEPGAGVEVMPDVTTFRIRGWIDGQGWADLPRPPDVTTQVNGLDVIIRRGNGESSETFNRVVSLK